MPGTAPTPDALDGQTGMNGFSFEAGSRSGILTSMSDMALHAFRRFGLGRRGTEPAPADVQGWLITQLDAADPLLSQPGPSTLNAVVIDQRYQAARKAGDMPPEGFTELFNREMTAALQHAATTDLPFRERLVWFWANHFTVASHAGPWPFGLNGAYVQEAIRPHVTGRFVDLAKAVMLHPAMLSYLDEEVSIGPDSPIGMMQHRGLNENLAREFMELHTLGVQAGYSQHDVTSFAALLTGRGFDVSGPNPGYVYHADMHEPGPQTLMGHSFPDGSAGSDTAIEWIATHPATYRHLATKLVQHFVADVPPAACVAKVETALRDSGGDLKQAYRAIIALPEAWQPLTKFRAPAEYVIAVQRAIDLPMEPAGRLLAATRDLGQPFRDPLLPNGWPDTAEDWVGGETLLKRADYAMTQASRPNAPPAEAVMNDTLGDLCSASTRAAVKACPNQAEALATLLASPEFMRR
jgi:uncharacterized protein (DUF1800 family)